MEITNIKIKVTENLKSRLKGVAIVVFDDVFTIRDIRIIDGDNGLFIAMPSFRLASGSYRDVCHPVCSKFKNDFDQAIINEFNKQVNNN